MDMELREELKTYITKKAKDFIQDQKKRSNLSTIRVSKLTGLEPFYIKKIESGEPVPVCDYIRVLKTYETPDICIQDFLNNLDQYSREYKARFNKF